MMSTSTSTFPSTAAPFAGPVPASGPFRRVERHMTTMITLAGNGIDDARAGAFFDRIRFLEGVLSRFREDSQVSRIARGELGVERADPSVAAVLARCEALRELTAGAFEHEPRRRSGDPRHPRLDVDAVAKGWIVDDAASVLRADAAEYLVNAGGDITAGPRPGGTPWRIAVQHPGDRSKVLGTFEIARGAVATSGSYERGGHIRGAGAPALTSVTVAGPDLATADGLATAVYASGQSPPEWWDSVEPSYGLLTLSAANRLRWLPPTAGTDVAWSFPAGSHISRIVG